MKRKKNDLSNISTNNLVENFKQFSVGKYVYKLDLHKNKFFGKVKRQDDKSVWVYVDWEDKSGYWVHCSLLENDE